MASANTARDNKRRLAAIKKQVQDSWEASRNPNYFGGAPVTDPTGKIIAIDVSAFGFVAEVFEDSYVQEKLLESFRKNNVHYNGLNDAEIEGSIKSSVEAAAPKPDKPIFILKAYAVQSYLSQLIRHVNKLSGRVVSGGLQWGLANKDAEVPEGWRDDLLEFFKYGGPATSYEGTGKLTPRIRDIICHYFYLLGLDVNDHCRNKPDDYKERDPATFPFLPPAEGFVFPSWSIHHTGPRNVEENVPLRPSNWNKRMRVQTSDEEEPEEPEASRPRLILRPADWNNATEELEEDEPVPDEDEPVPEERPRIVLHIPKSRLKTPSAFSKPPKKTPRMPTAVHCLECGEPETAVDVRTKNGFVKCGDHQSHKYCKQSCVKNHDLY